MSARKITKCFTFASCLLPLLAVSAPFQATDETLTPPPTYSLTQEAIAQQLGWVSNENYNCGGYYLEQPFVYPISVQKKNLVEITGNEGLLSQRGTSTLTGKVTVTREGQQITSNKAYLYRDPTTGKLSAMDMIGNVHLREPNTLIVAKKGYYNFETKMKSLIDVVYRTSIQGRQIIGPNVAQEETEKERKITHLTAWGSANEVSQAEPKIYDLSKASYSTCPPINPSWKVKASHIVLNKNTGRGYATHARILVKNIPIFYTPYINFPIDSRRKSGFLWPTFGGGNTSGPSLYVPYYWNMAPNYDMTITPAILMKRGVQLSDNFRYLTETSHGDLDISVLPGDKDFSIFKTTQTTKYGTSTDPLIQAEVNRLANDSDTRKAFSWRNESQFNSHWSSHIDFNYVGDDYYLQDLGNGDLNKITQNQLLQEGDILYKSENWNFTGRVQAYQTLHPIIVNQPPTQNAYRRLPQLILSADYPDQKFGLEYFITNEATHFDILKTPGTNLQKPVGNRLHTQPGISLPINLPYFFINPRAQLALTSYDLTQTAATDTPKSIGRSVPIFDVAAGLSFNRDASWFGRDYQQTLEPQVYYTYIPYRNQSAIPVFDTTVNTLKYDQIFNYNRFSGIDRIGDANQIGVGVTTRLLDQETGLEKIRFGVGGIVYFANRNVTLCESGCVDNPSNHSNYQRLSPISALLNYNVIQYWSVTAESLWNPVSKQIDNTTVGVHFVRDQFHVINFGYNYARGGDILSGITSLNDPSNNLKVTDVSAAWPLFQNISAVGLWSQNWNHKHLQNLLYGLQYDTCCWAVRFVGGRAFAGLDSTDNNKLLYDNQFFIQFSLKGMGGIGPDPTKLLSSISGYNPQFGQEI